MQILMPQHNMVDQIDSSNIQAQGHKHHDMSSRAIGNSGMNQNISA
jgi:hypothetical protein